MSGWRAASFAGWCDALDRPRERWGGPWEAAEDLAPPVIGRLGEGLADAAVRDAVILRTFGASSGACAAIIAGTASREVDVSLDAVMRGSSRPDPDPVEALDATLMRIERLCNGRAAAEASAVRALLAWWWGDLESCLVAARSAVASDAECRLGALLCETASLGMLPGWLRESG